MKILFDSQIFCHRRFGGIARYVVNLVSELARSDGVTPLIAAPFHFNEYLERLPAALVRGRRVRWLEGATALAFAASAIPGRRIAAQFQPDIVHNTFYYPARTVRGAFRVLTVHDMIHEKFPHAAAANRLIARWKAACVKRADQLICVSENTKRDLLDLTNIQPERITVTPLGYDDLALLCEKDTEVEFKNRVLGTTSPYLLYVGARSGYKNFAGFLTAYAASPWLRSNFILLCFGGGGFTRTELGLMSRLGVIDQVKRTGGGDRDLAASYRHASLFVYPSLYEGFGIPPLEAMSVDCPVACSDNSSLPEVVGDAAALFDASDPESIRAEVETALGSTLATAALVERGRIRCRMFSWTRCAAQTLELYRQIGATP